jgi:hypothetical protein
MARPFHELRDELNRRLDELPGGEGDRIRRRTRERLARELREYADAHPDDEQARAVADSVARRAV